jgi:integrase/recombinase XerD
MDAFAGWSLERGFSLDTARSHIASLQRLVPWFRRRGKRSVVDFCADDITEARRYYRLRNANWAAAIQKLGEFLRSQGTLKPGRPRPITPTERAVSCFTKYLQSERGLAVNTIEGHQHYLRQFLCFLGWDRRRKALKDLKLEDIHQFLGRMSSRCRRESMVHVVATIRAFLRFQFTRGALTRPLHKQIDSVRIYQGERLPEPLPWPDFQKLLRKMDRSTLLGLRDFTIMLLAATYGLRRSEVAGSKLDDIQWQTHTLRIPQVKTRQSLWLPLTDEMGAALADYLKRRGQFPSLH